MNNAKRRVGDLTPAQVLRAFVEGEEGLSSIQHRSARHLWLFEVEYALRRAIRKLQRRLARAEAESKARRAKP